MPHAVDWLFTFLASPRSIWLPTHAPALSPIEWLAFLAPFALGATGATLCVIEVMSMRWQRISVDDAGVTVQRPLRRSQFIPWDDIHLILRFGGDEAPGNTWWLRDHRRGVALALGARGPVPSPKGHPRASTYQFDAAPDDYPAAVQRLLATLTERARVPIRVWAGAYLTSQPRSVTSAGGLTLDEALALPLAAEALQPNPTDVEAERASAATVTLRPSITLRALAPQIAKNVAITAGLFVAIILVALVPGASSVNEVIAPLLSPAGLRAIAYIVCAMIVLSVGGAVTTYRNVTAPTVAASPAGLTLKPSMGASPRVIPWQDIKAWAVLLPAPAARAPVIYTVWSGAQTLEWREPPDAQLAGRGVHGDRREAYRATARQLRTLIAARTGRPLRAIQPRLKV